MVVVVFNSRGPWQVCSWYCAERGELNADDDEGGKPSERPPHLIMQLLMNRPLPRRAHSLRGTCARDSSQCACVIRTIAGLCLKQRCVSSKRRALSRKESMGFSDIPIGKYRPGQTKFNLSMSHHLLGLALPRHSLSVGPHGRSTHLVDRTVLIHGDHRQDYLQLRLDYPTTKPTVPRPPDLIDLFFPVMTEQLILQGLLHRQTLDLKQPLRSEITTNRHRS
jgi:hypothetical protein